MIAPELTRILMESTGLTLPGRFKEGGGLRTRYKNQPRQISVLAIDHSPAYGVSPSGSYVAQSPGQTKETPTLPDSVKPQLDTLLIQDGAFYEEMESRLFIRAGINVSVAKSLEDSMSTIRQASSKPDILIIGSEVRSNGHLLTPENGAVELLEYALSKKIPVIVTIPREEIMVTEISPLVVMYAQGKYFGRLAVIRKPFSEEDLWTGLRYLCSSTK